VFRLGWAPIWHRSAPGLDPLIKSDDKHQTGEDRDDLTPREPE